MYLYLYNEFIVNILNDINTLLCPSKNKSNTIELTVHTYCYLGLRLTMCYHYNFFQIVTIFRNIRANFVQARSI